MSATAPATNLPRRIPGAGLKVEIPKRILTEEQKRVATAKLTHYIYFPLGAPGSGRPGHPHYGDLYIGDRQTIPLQYIMRGVICRLDNYDYMTRNQSESALIKDNANDEVEFAPWTVYAGEQADELVSAYNNISDQRGLVSIRSLVGAPDDLAGELERMIMPEIPDKIIDINRALITESPKAIDKIADKELRKRAKLILEEMQGAADQGLRYAIDHVQMCEAEQVERSKPNGTGKVKLTAVDLYYYDQLNRVPKNETGSIYLSAQMARDVEAEQGPSMKQCPECAEDVKAAAIKCRWCGAMMLKTEDTKVKK